MSGTRPTPRSGPCGCPGPRFFRPPLYHRRRLYSTYVSTAPAASRAAAGNSSRISAVSRRVRRIHKLTAPAAASPAAVDPAPSAKRPQHLWDQAYDALKRDEPALMAAYEKILSCQLQNGLSSPKLYSADVYDYAFYKVMHCQAAFVHVVWLSLAQAKAATAQFRRRKGKFIGSI
ncbi:hypothetical protein B0T25DRAFT_631442 [Lasiosphaeria hispida]|uniref:Uncharacterized protein n=1 Tax=Lasiosphaeria hispida TaxID=260671 RepID=A0AAJ0HHV7_9PEZI|nr:hypothetical protein B0T25DRAFT_631442 [Lasiosphaeria hispida]